MNDKNLLTEQEMGDGLLSEEEISLLSYARARRKADQHWELAGCARHDGDTKEELRHTALAREYSRWAAELKVINLP